MPKVKATKTEENSEVAEQTTPEVVSNQEVKATKKSSKNKETTFEFKNGGSRTFSEADHGDNWEDLANEFQESNKKILLNRDGEAI